MGATRHSHRSDAVAALDIVLTADELNVLESPYVPHAVVAMFVPPGPALEARVVG